MKLKRGQLLDSDYDTLFTKDPATFFESVLINILWDKTPGSIDQDTVARQKQIFLKWHEYFKASHRTDIEREIANKIFAEAHRAGQVYALAALPFTDKGFGLLGKTVDLIAVSDKLKELKALEPVGVK